MSTVVYIGSITPDKKLIQEHIYHYHPDAAMREKIISDIKKHSKRVMDSFIVEIKIEVTLKEYDIINKKTTDDPQDTRI